MAREPSKEDKVIVASGRFTNYVVRGHWEYIERKGATGVVGILAITDADEVVLVEQYRPPVNAQVIEIPAGLVGDGDKRHEPVEDAVRRELLEETGFEAREVRHLFSGVSSAGLSDEIIHLYQATGLHRVNDGGGDDSEDITVHLVPRDELLDWLKKRQKQGVIIDLKISAALHLAE